MAWNPASVLPVYLRRNFNSLSSRLATKKNSLVFLFSADYNFVINKFILTINGMKPNISSPRLFHRDLWPTNIFWKICHSFHQLTQVTFKYEDFKEISTLYPSNVKKVTILNKNGHFTMKTNILSFLNTHREQCAH